MEKSVTALGMAVSCAVAASAATCEPRTYCNPLPLPDLPRSVYEIGRTPHRQVSDPTLFRENGIWYVYPSAGFAWKSEDDGGTWRTLPNPSGLQGHGPTMVKHRGRYFYMPDTAGTVYEASSPEGPWRKLGVIALPEGTLDPSDAMLFSDDDGRLYFYWGCSPVDGIWGCELDADNPCKPISAPRKLIPFDPVRHPWERHATLPNVGWLEGAWMMKVGKTYVLVYSAGGAENAGYAMGAYRSDSPLGEFRPQKNNPFFVNPTGFITGTGHGSLVKDERGEWWISYCITAGDQHRFERRIGMDRIVVGADGEIAVTKATDEPQWLPKHGKGAAGWRKIPVSTASPAAADGLYQTHVWFAGLPTTVEFTFEKPQTVRAFRVVWREGCYNPDKGVDAGPVRYRVRVRRTDGEWTVACDASANDRDLVTDYRETEPVEATAARLEVLEKPRGLELGLSEWTLFGTEPSAAKAHKIRVACVGDSITWGSAMTNRAEDCYPAQLQRLLGDGYDVRNFGDGGSGVYLTPHPDAGNWTPHPWRKGAQSAAAYAFKPDVVICNFGINDVGNHDDELKGGKTGRPFAERGTFVREYVDLLKAFRAEGREPKYILWTRLGPTARKNCLHDKPWAREMEPDLRRVASEVDAISLDMHTPLLPFVETAHYAKDGIHPECGAHAVIAAITANAVLQACEPFVADGRDGEREGQK